MATEYYLLEDGTKGYLLESGSGDLLLESSTASSGGMPLGMMMRGAATIAAAWALFAGPDTHVITQSAAASQVTPPGPASQPLLNSPLAFRSSASQDAEQDAARRVSVRYPSSNQTTGGMPLPLMQQATRRVEVEAQEIRTASPTLHLFRVGYQTVQGMTLARLHKPSTRVDEVVYEVRSAAPTLHFFRPGYATVVQPLALTGGRPSTRVEAESFEVRSAAPTLHRFRTGFQTVGHPLPMITPRASVRVEAELDAAMRRAILYPSSNPATSGGRPLALYLQPRFNSTLHDQSQFTLHSAYSPYANSGAQAVAASTYQPLLMLQRLPMKWALIDPAPFAGLVAKLDRFGPPSIDVTGTVSYAFEFGYWTHDVPDLNEEIWQTQVRYYTNYGAQMMPFRQYRQISLTTQEYDATANGSTTYCVEVDSFDNDPATPPASWTPEGTSGTWSPPAAPGGGWSPPSAPTGAWNNDPSPSGGWTTQQKQC